MTAGVADVQVSKTKPQQQANQSDDVKIADDFWDAQMTNLKSFQPNKSLESEVQRPTNEAL